MIAVIGATGTIGCHVAAGLAATGEPARAVVRNPRRAPEPPVSAWQITGPGAVTFDEVASLMGARYVNVPLRIAAAALRRRGASAFEAEHATRMAAYFASGADGAATKAVEQLAGHPPRTLDTFLTEHRSAKGSRT